LKVEVSKFKVAQGYGFVSFGLRVFLGLCAFIILRSKITYRLIFYKTPSRLLGKKEINFLFGGFGQIIFVQHLFAARLQSFFASKAGKKRISV
jgi:hypothetical protein